MHIQVLHGPNLNLLGSREPHIYGRVGLAEIDRSLAKLAAELGVELDSLQSNHEGELIDCIQRSTQSAGFLVNPAGLGHSSVALRDALLAVSLPFVEVHCSNILARESFRHATLLSDVALGFVAGFGANSYTLGLRALVAHLRLQPETE
jgi:3-dehydroquinate dehydratase-2